MRLRNINARVVGDALTVEKMTPAEVQVRNDAYELGATHVAVARENIYQCRGGERLSGPVWEDSKFNYNVNPCNSTQAMYTSACTELPATAYKCTARNDD